MLAQALRSLLFLAFFWIETVVLSLVIGASAMVAGRTRFGWGAALYWVYSNRFALWLFGGVRTVVEGEENIPDGPAIIAAKHMSDWDIFAILPASRRPAFIAKKELMDIPFFGHAAKSFDTIRIDRSLGAQAIPAMIEEARAALSRGARIIIFPEGTRKAPLAEPDYRQGIVKLYEALNVPVVPVGLNSGLFWGRNSALIWRGTAKARFLPPIPPGLDGESFKARLIADIEGESNRLMFEAYEKGLARPISDEMRVKLEALRPEGARSTAPGA